MDKERVGVRERVSTLTKVHIETARAFLLVLFFDACASTYTENFFEFLKFLLESGVKKSPIFSIYYEEVFGDSKKRGLYE